MLVPFIRKNTMNINQYAILQLELLKELKINDQVMPAVKFELNLPYGCPWEAAFDACDDFKITLQNMQARQQEDNAAKAKAAEEQASPIIEPEIVNG